MSSETRDKIIGLVKYEMRIPDSRTLADSDRLVEDLGMDELDLVEVVMKIEGMFNINIDDTDLKGVDTLGQLIDLVEGKTTDADV